MKRNAFENLIRWKEKDGRKPLIIQGARQVGKTWLMKEFAKTRYKNVAYVSFNDREDAKRIFDDSYDVDNIILSLSAVTGVRISPEDTLIIFDEIQECERALNVLKFFNENAPQYHIMAAGSLLGVAVRQKNMSFPVGQVEFLNLYPLTFGEFLDAVGEQQLSSLIFEDNKAVIRVVKEKYITLLKQYMFVGGMPEAVQKFVKNKNFNEVRDIQNQILEGYRQDFSKYTEPRSVARITSVWNSVPAQLAKENKKFSYQVVDKSARAREYEIALEWLVLCGLVYKIPRITKPDLPLSAYEDMSAFKLYMLDTGLLCAKSGLDAQTIINGNAIFEEFKGSLTEQYVLQELKAQKELFIAYWSKKSGTAEVDFVIQDNSKIIPVEVKASVNLKAKSLASYREQYQPEKAIRTSLADFEINGGLYNIPLYLIENLSGILKK